MDLTSGLQAAVAAAVSAVKIADLTDAAYCAALDSVGDAAANGDDDALVAAKVTAYATLDAAFLAALDAVAATEAFAVFEAENVLDYITPF